VKVFLTGGTGLVGRHLALALIQRTDHVVCVTRNETRARSLLPVGAEFIQGDPTQPGPWQEAISGCDAVVNLAGESVAKGFWSEARKRAIRRSRLATTRNVAEAMARAGAAGVLVSASATGYYGDGGSVALDESAQPGSGFLARLAREWEGTALVAESGPTRVVLLRIGVVLARDGGALPRLAIPFKLGLGGPLGSGKQYFPWIHIRDLVRIILFALDTGNLTGPVNAVVPDPPPQRTFARALGSVLHRPSLLPVPAFLLRMALGEKADMILASQRVIPRALRARGFQFECDDLQQALTDLLG
jgi:uncharacterized protein (TIGR01777 family)